MLGLNLACLFKTSGSLSYIAVILSSCCIKHMEDVRRWGWMAFKANATKIEIFTVSMPTQILNEANTTTEVVLKPTIIWYKYQILVWISENSLCSLLTVIPVQIVAISFVCGLLNLAWFNLHEISLRLLFPLCLASLCLFPSYLLLDPADTTQTLGLFLSPLPLPRSSTSTSEDLAVAVSERRRRVQKKTHTLLPVSLISFSESERKGDVGRRKEGKGGICFHCSVVKPWSDHKGILTPVTEKTFNTYSTWFYLSWQFMCVIGEAVNPIRNQWSRRFIFSSFFSLTLSSC